MKNIANIYKKNKNKKNISNFLLIGSILFGFLSILFCVFINPKNSNFNSLIFLSVIKAIPMIFIIFMAFVEIAFLRNNEYRKCIIAALVFSLFGDVSIVFNFIIGGISFLIASIFFILAFFNHYSFKKKLLNNNCNYFLHQFIFGITVSFIFFFLFILYAFIFVFPLLSKDLDVFRFLFPLYILFLSFAVGASFFGNVPNSIKIAMIIFLFSDIVLFFGFAFGFTPIVTIMNLTLYYLSQNIFAKNIDE